MAMQKSKRRELAKLRELCLYLLRGRKCCFCKQALTDYDGETDGDGRARPLTERITIHHLNYARLAPGAGHLDKRRSNERLAHFACHKAHHAKTHPRVGGKFVNKEKAS